MSNDQSFGDWLRQHRRALDLTQEELARQVGCSAITLRKLEAEERKPSKQIAERLADVLKVAPDERANFLRFARGDPFASPDVSPTTSEAAQKSEQLEAPLHNLPVQLTSFVGRRGEIAEIQGLLTPSLERHERSGAREGWRDSAGVGVRLVTLTGPGGTGKTRLALQAAASLLDASAFPDGVWLVELAPLTDPDLIPQTVAAVFALKEDVGHPLLATLTDHLRGKTALLILDNCEHLIQASARFAQTLLQACPRLYLLASSREILGVAGERSLYVPSLSTPEPRTLPPIKTLLGYEAVRLFVERAAVAAPGFTLTSANAPAVVQVCQRLDGIPLAIELAVARLRMLPVEQIVARLDDTFRLLTGGSRTALPRHQTLQALIDWSYGLLTIPEQVLLQRLAVFAGGWSLEAAETVGAGDGIPTGEVFDLLGHLIDKSLVLATPQAGAHQARYHLLETIRQYGLAKLVASGEADAARQRHAAYHLDLSETGMPAPYQKAQPAWLDQIETEHDNVRAALTWAQSAAGGAELGLRLAVSMCYFWGGHGFWSEARDWLEVALAHAETEPLPDQRILTDALLNIAGFLEGLGDYAEAQAQATRCLRLSREAGNIPGTASALGQLGHIAREQGDAVTARLRLEESLALYQELGFGHEPRIPWMLNTLGEVAVVQEDVAWATSLLEEGLSLFKAQEVPEGIAWSLNHLGHVAQLQGKYERARQLHEDSLPLFRVSAVDNLGNLGVAWAFQGLGETALAQGSATSAATHLGNALVLFRELGDRAGMAWCLAGLAGAAALDEEPERAARLWGAAEALRLSIGTRQAPAARATREQLMAEAREQMGNAAFDVAWAEGQAMTLEQAVAEATQDG